MGFSKYNLFHFMMCCKKLEVICLRSNRALVVCLFQCLVLHKLHRRLPNTNLDFQIAVYNALTGLNYTDQKTWPPAGLCKFFLKLLSPTHLRNISNSNSMRTILF